MKLHRATCAALAAALLLGLGACGEATSAEGEDPAVQDNPSFEAGTTMDELAKAGTMTVGTKFDQPLFGLKGLDGKPTGFDVEIAKIIAGELGIAEDDMEFIETPSAVREEAILSNKVDIVVATYFITEERRQRVSFGGPYYVAGTTLMVAADDDKITGPEALEDSSLKVCSATGAGQNEVISEYMSEPDNQLVLFDVYSKCADALRTGQVDAVVSDSTVLLGLVHDSDGKFKIVGDSIQDQPFGVGITKGDVEFCEFIDDTLTAAAEDGRYAEAWEKTAGQAEPEVPELPDLDPCS